jgi:hypothetical protein
MKSHANASRTASPKYGHNMRRRSKTLDHTPTTAGVAPSSTFFFLLEYPAQKEQRKLPFLRHF